MITYQQEFEKLLDDSEGDIETNAKDFAALLSIEFVLFLFPLSTM